MLWGTRTGGGCGGSGSTSAAFKFLELAFLIAAKRSSPPPPPPPPPPPAGAACAGKAWGAVRTCVHASHGRVHSLSHASTRRCSGNCRGEQHVWKPNAEEKP